MKLEIFTRILKKCVLFFLLHFFPRHPVIGKTLEQRLLLFRWSGERRYASRARDWIETGVGTIFVWLRILPTLLLLNPAPPASSPQRHIRNTRYFRPCQRKP